MKLPRVVGVIVAHVLALAASLYWRTPPALRPFLPYLAGGLFWGAVITVLMLTSGCHAPAPERVVLPSAVPVRKALAVVQDSHRQVEQLVADAAVHGLTANSTAAQTLKLATAAEGSQLAILQQQVDQLTAHLLTAQNETDAQTQRLADVETKYAAAVKTIWWYRVRFWGPLTMAVLALVIYVLTRFTSWGARTFGPYILGVEKVAAKVAVAV